MSLLLLFGGNTVNISAASLILVFSIDGESGAFPLTVEDLALDWSIDGEFVSVNITSEDLETDWSIDGDDMFPVIADDLELDWTIEGDPISLWLYSEDLELAWSIDGDGFNPGVADDLAIAWSIDGDPQVIYVFADDLELDWSIGGDGFDPRIADDLILDWIIEGDFASVWIYADDMSSSWIIEGDDMFPVISDDLVLSWIIEGDLASANVAAENLALSWSFDGDPTIEIAADNLEISWSIDGDFISVWVVADDLALGWTNDGFGFNPRTADDLEIIWSINGTTDQTFPLFADDLELFWEFPACARLPNQGDGCIALPDGGVWIIVYPKPPSDAGGGGIPEEGGGSGGSGGYSYEEGTGGEDWIWVPEEERCIVIDIAGFKLISAAPFIFKWRLNFGFVVATSSNSVSVIVGDDGEFLTNWSFDGEFGTAVSFTKPKTLLEIVTDSGTLYISDQPVTVDAQEYDAKTLYWGEVKSPVILSEDLIRMSGFNFEISNNPRIDSQIRPGLEVRLYLWFDGLTEADKVLLFKGVITDNIKWDVYRIKLTAMDISELYDKELGNALPENRTDGQTWYGWDANFLPNYLPDPDDIGKIIPYAAYGEIRNHPCLAAEAGAANTLAWEMSDIGGQADGTSTNKLHDADGNFPVHCVGQTVTNTDTSNTATITARVDSGELTLSANIFVSGQNYSIDMEDADILVTDGSRFPNSGTVTIGSEDISYTSKTLGSLGYDWLKGITRGANGTDITTHTLGDAILEKVSSVTYIAFDHKVKEMSNARIFPEGFNIKDAVKINPDYVTYNTDNYGKSTVTLTQLAAIAREVQIAILQQPGVSQQPGINQQPGVNQQPGINHYGHTHAMTSIAQITLYGSSISRKSNVTDENNVLDQNDDTKANLMQGSGTLDGPCELFINFATSRYDGFEIIEATACVRHRAYSSWTTWLFTTWSSTNFSVDLSQSGAFVKTQKFIVSDLIGKTDWSKLNALGVYANRNYYSALGSVGYVYEIWWEIKFSAGSVQKNTNAGFYLANTSSTQVKVAESSAKQVKIAESSAKETKVAETPATEVVIGGDSVADYLLGRLIIDAKGWEDESDGHYTGTGDPDPALLDKPCHIFHSLLEKYSNGMTHDEIDATSFNDCFNEMPSSYKFAFVMRERISLLRLLAHLALQCNARFFYEAGQAKLVWKKTNQSSVKSIDTDDHVLLERDRLPVQISQRPLDEIVNDIEIKFNLEPTLGSRNDPDAYEGITQASDSASIALYKKRQRTWLFSAVGDNLAMAQDLRNKMLNFYKTDRKEISFPAYLLDSELERGDVVDITCSQLGITSKKHEIIEIDYFPPVPVRKRAPRILIRALEMG